MHERIVKRQTEIQREFREGFSMHCCTHTHTHTHTHTRTHTHTHTHTEWRTKCHTIDCAHNTFLLLQKHLTSGTELIPIGWKIVPNGSL